MLYYIRTNKGFREVDGQTIKGFGFHRSPSNQWVITDTKTGLLVARGFPKQKDCYEYMESEEHKREIQDRISKRQDYNQLVEELKQHKKEAKKS